MALNADLTSRLDANSLVDGFLATINGSAGSLNAIEAPADEQQLAAASTSGGAFVPGPIRDAYGCGDSFAAGLTFALGDGRAIADAVELAARCGAACLTGRGPYERQLTAA